MGMSIFRLIYLANFVARFLVGLAIGFFLGYLYARSGLTLSTPALPFSVGGVVK